MANHYHLIFCTCPDKVTAQSIADKLVDDALAACVNILPGLTSVYQWQGKRETTEETLLLIKSATRLYDRLESRLLQLHPYEVPEIIAINLDQGLPAYLSWLEGNLQPAVSK